MGLFLHELLCVSFVGILFGKIAKSGISRVYF